MYGFNLKNPHKYAMHYKMRVSTGYKRKIIILVNEHWHSNLLIRLCAEHFKVIIDMNVLQAYTIVFVIVFFSIYTQMTRPQHNKTVLYKQASKQ